jgi:hypothetical protein
MEDYIKVHFPIVAHLVPADRSPPSADLIEKRQASADAWGALLRPAPPPDPMIMVSGPSSTSTSGSAGDPTTMVKQPKINPDYEAQLKAWSEREHMAGPFRTATVAAITKIMSSLGTQVRNLVESSPEFAIIIEENNLYKLWLLIPEVIFSIGAQNGDDFKALQDLVNLRQGDNEPVSQVVKRHEDAIMVLQFTALKATLSAQEALSYGFIQNLNHGYRDLKALAANGIVKFKTTKEAYQLANSWIIPEAEAGGAIGAAAFPKKFDELKETPHHAAQPKFFLNNKGEIQYSNSAWKELSSEEKRTVKLVNSLLLKCKNDAPGPNKASRHRFKHQRPSTTTGVVALAKESQRNSPASWSDDDEPPVDKD